MQLIAVRAKHRAAAPLSEVEGARLVAPSWALSATLWQEQKVVLSFKRHLDCARWDFVHHSDLHHFLQSLAVQVPPWDFQEVAVHPTELSEEGVPQWRCCFETECEHHRQMETDKWRQCPDWQSQISAQLVVRSVGTETRLIVRCCPQFVVGFVVIDPVVLVKFTFHPLSVVLSATVNLETGLIYSSIWLSTFVTFSRMVLETPAWNKRKSEVVASQGQGRRAVRQEVAEGGSEREVLRRFVEVLATLSLVNAAELRELTATVFKTYLVPWQRQWQRQGGSITKQRAPSRTDPRQNAQRLTNSSVHRTCTCGWRSCAAWQRRRGWRQSTCRP